MITELVGVVWKKIPWSLRRSIIRVTQPKFTISAGAIITNRAGDILLLDHHIRPFSGWGIPGGFLEHGEQPEDGIRREIREEIGVELQNLRMFRVRTVNTHVEILFRAVTDGTPEVKSSEIKDFGWFKTDEMPEQMNNAEKRFIQSVLNDEFEK